MRILHTSHGSLPDARIEKTALTMKKRGHKLLFLGCGSTNEGYFEAFDQVCCIPKVSTPRVVLDPLWKNLWAETIDRIDPDIVHAHNLVAASMMLDMDYPVIYDDHEYWSKQIFKYSSRGLLRRLAAIPLMQATPKLERRILQKYPTLTVSQEIAREHRRFCPWVGVTRNFPLLQEVDSLADKQNRAGAAYVGNDFNLKKFLPHRNMKELRNYVDFDVIAGFSYEKMMKELTKYRFGLTPWKPHPFHKYCSPNKNYEYLHAGLSVILTNTLLDISLEDNPYVHTFERYKDIQKIMKSTPEISGDKIMDYARSRYVWEKQENVIDEAYSHAEF